MSDERVQQICDRYGWRGGHSTQFAESIEKLESIIRQIQWSSISVVVFAHGDHETTKLCPLCDQTEKNGHAPDCKIGMVLGEEK